MIDALQTYEKTMKHIKDQKYILPSQSDEDLISNKSNEATEDQSDKETDESYHEVEKAAVEGEEDIKAVKEGVERLDVGEEDKEAGSDEEEQPPLPDKVGKAKVTSIHINSYWHNFHDHQHLSSIFTNTITGNIITII